MQAAHAEAAARQAESARALWAQAPGLLALFLLGLWVRWDRLQYAEFAADQAWVLSRARDLVEEGEVPLAGIGSSAGAAQGPIEIYLLALPAALGDDPVVATAFVGLLQLLAVIGTYFFTARHFGRTTAWVATVLFSANPWALHFSRKLWTPDLLPFFSLLYFAAVFAAVVERKKHQYSLACLWFSFLFFIHPQVLVYTPLLLGIAVVGWRRHGLRPLLLGGAGALLVAAPYLYHDAQIGFHNLRSYLGTAGASAQVDLEGPRQLVMMASAAGFPTLMSYGFRGEWPLSDQTAGNALATGLLAVGLAWVLWRAGLAAVGRGAAGDGAKCGLLALWLLLPALLTVRHTMNLLPHYFLVVYPVQFILIGLALARLPALAARYGRGVGRQAAMAAVALVALSLSASQLAFFQGHVDAIERQGPTWPYGVPLAYSKQLVHQLRSIVARLGGPPVYVYAFNQRLGLDYLTNGEPRLEHVDPPREVVLPRDLSRGVLFVLASNDAAAAPQTFPVIEDQGPIVQRIRALGGGELAEQRLVGPGGYAYYRLFYLPPGQAATARADYKQLQQRLALADGLSLAGYQLSESATGGGVLPLGLLWEMPRDPERYKWSEYFFTAHLVDGQGRDLAQRDWEIFHYLGWQKDGYVATKYELPLPPAATPSVVWLEVGAYERYSRQLVPWTDDSGAPQGRTYRIGPLRLLPAALPPPPSARIGRALGDLMMLEGYDLNPSGSAAPGDEVGVSLHWRSLAHTEQDYTVSVQLLDGGGKLVAQHDSPPAGGNYPTRYWTPGEQVVDKHSLVVPPDASPGEYRLHVVVYASDTGRRLVAGAGETVELASLLVAERGGPR